MCSRNTGKPELVIVNAEQFGYNPATFYYCKYLNSKLAITYIGLDQGHEKLQLPGITVQYVEKNTNYIVRGYRFLRKILSYTTQKNTILLIKYVKVISILLRIFRPFNPLIIDIRTGYISSNQLNRFASDLLLKFECKFFKNVTVISCSLAKKLGLEKKAHILPIGADVISETTKEFNQLNLLYVGTLFNRNIDQALLGFAKFYLEYQDKIPMRFTIIGRGPGDEETILRTITDREGLSDVVSIVGQVPHNKLKEYFDAHNIGISYIPITSYFDVQPPTKTFEYLLSGMPVIATTTQENSKIITEDNGILIQDNPESFYESLKLLFAKRNMFNSKKIQHESAKKYSWEKIVNNLSEYILQLTERKI